MADKAPGGGGGGSGGTIIIRGYEVNLSSATLSANGGAGGDGGQGKNNQDTGGGGGGGGAGGRLKIFYGNASYTAPLSAMIDGGTYGVGDTNETGDDGQIGINGCFYENHP